MSKMTKLFKGSDWRFSIDKTSYISVHITEIRFVYNWTKQDKTAFVRPF